MSRPSPKSNLIQTLLIATVIFLLFQMFMAPKGPPDTRPSEEILTTMSKTLGELGEGGSAERQQKLRTLQSALGALKQRLGAERQEGKITPEAEFERQMNGEVLLGVGQLRVGSLDNDMGPVSQAYISLHDTYRRNLKNPVITEKSFEVPPHEKFEKSSYTVATLHEEITGQLKLQSSNHLILGLIPGHRLIDALVKLTGAVPAFSYAFAAFLLALIVRGMIWPLAQKQYLWGRQMSQLAPLVAEIKARYTDKNTGQVRDMQEFNQKVMGLYREYGINPMSGCLPALIQIPYFLLIYQCMVQYRLDFQNGTFLWINPGASAATNGFIAPNLGERDYLLIVIYAASMIVTTLLTPVSDPNNVRQQRMMGLFIAVFFSIAMFFYPLPSAFVLYWVFTNVFATIQMLRAYRMPPPPLVKKVSTAGGVIPPDAPASGNGQAAKTGRPVKHRPKKKK